MEISLFADIEQRLLKARVQLSLQQPFLAAALMRLPFRQISGMSWCNTMATDGYHIFYNPEWSTKLKNNELRGVIAHEVLHVVFAHSDRLLERTPNRWNLACDFAINLLLIEQGFTLPEGGMYLKIYEGLTADEIYEKLPPDLNIKFDNFGHPNTASEQEQSGQIYPIGNDLIPRDDPRVKPLQDMDMPDTEQMGSLRENLRQDSASKLHGRSAAYFKQECMAADEGSVDWKSLMRNWLFDRIKSDWSSYPFSKKHIHRGLFMPSMGVQSPGHIVFAIDTSGSMSIEDISEIISEIRGFRDVFPCKLTIIQADVEIQSTIEYEEMDGIEIPSRMEISGRGGTSFEQVIELVDESIFGSKVLIYATDGFGSFPKINPDFPVIWLLTPYSIEIKEIPFGSIVKLKLN
jgi:predicted metal-dependent peptidase